MKHLVAGPGDVTLGIRGLGRLPRGNGRVPGVGERNTNSCCPLPKTGESNPPPARRSHGALVPPCGNSAQLAWVAQGSLEKSDRRGHQIGLRAPEGGRCVGEPSGWVSDCWRPPRLSSIGRDQNIEPGGFASASIFLEGSSQGVCVRP